MKRSPEGKKTHVLGWDWFMLHKSQPVMNPAVKVWWATNPSPSSLGGDKSVRMKESHIFPKKTWPIVLYKPM